MPPVVLKTKYLFLILLHYIRPSTILDVGSRDGGEALRFRGMLPDASIVAFEANPYLYEAMQADSRLSAARINVVNRVVSPEKGPVRFHIASGGRSSLLPYEGESQDTIEIPTAGLSEYLSDCETAALWIDTEGAGYEVLSTAARQAQKVLFIHIESELLPFWRGQKLKPDVVKLASDLGFSLIAHSRDPEQQDLVFVSDRMLNERAVRRALILARVHGPLFARWLAVSDPAKRQI